MSNPSLPDPAPERPGAPALVRLAAICLLPLLAAAAETRFEDEPAFLAYLDGLNLPEATPAEAGARLSAEGFTCTPIRNPHVDFTTACERRIGSTPCEWHFVGLAAAAHGSGSSVTPKFGLSCP